MADFSSLQLAGWELQVFLSIVWIPPSIPRAHLQFFVLCPSPQTGHNAAVCFFRSSKTLRASQLAGPCTYTMQSWEEPAHHLSPILWLEVSHRSLPHTQGITQRREHQETGTGVPPYSLPTITCAH